MLTKVQDGRGSRAVGATEASGGEGGAELVYRVVRRSFGRLGSMGGLAKTLRWCHAVREVREGRC